jgi:hypothetical protein
MAHPGGTTMTNRWIILALLACTPWLLGQSCSGTDRYRKSQNLMGVVELGPFPKMAAGVGGYNLYIAKAMDGPFEKINDTPVLGGTRLMVPYLDPGKDYYFRMTSVSSRDKSKESPPGQVFKRQAALKN